MTEYSEGIPFLTHGELVSRTARLDVYVAERAKLRVSSIEMDDRPTTPRMDQLYDYLVGDGSDVGWRRDLAHEDAGTCDTCPLRKMMNDKCPTAVDSGQLTAEQKNGPEGVVAHFNYAAGECPGYTTRTLSVTKFTLPRTFWERLLGEGSQEHFTVRTTNCSNGAAQLLVARAVEMNLLGPEPSDYWDARSSDPRWQKQHATRPRSRDQELSLAYGLSS